MTHFAPVQKKELFTMVKVNQNYLKLPGSYLFSEVARRIAAHSAAHPEAKIIKLDDVKSVGKFLIEIMPVMFIPAGVGLMSSWGTLKPVLLPVSIITVVVIIAVMLAAGWVSQIVIRRDRKKETENE